jgi:hypothetical protein
MPRRIYTIYLFLAVNAIERTSAKLLSPYDMYQLLTTPEAYGMPSRLRLRLVPLKTYGIIINYKQITQESVDKYILT